MQHMVSHAGCAFSAERMRWPTLRRGVQVGVNVTITPHVTFGAYSVIGSGAVITRGIPPHSLVVGNPVRVIKQIEAITCTTGVAGSHDYHPYLYVASQKEGGES